MARPKKDESIRRTKNVMVRFTDVEYALVSCSAEQAGYPVAVYVRKQAITEKLHVHYNIVADIAELRDFARQLSHIGNNLNQIAAFFNSGGIQSRAMLEEINRCMTDLRAMRKEIAGLGQYLSTKATYKEFLQAGNKKMYRSAHQDEIARYEEAVQFLKRNSTNGTIPTMKNLRAEKEKLLSARTAQYESYIYFKDYYHELQTACRNVDMILETEHTQQHSRTQPKRSYEQSI